MMFRDMHAAVDHLFAHRKLLRKVAVRLQFWPTGLCVAAHLSPSEDIPAERAMLSRQQEVIPWDQLETMTLAELNAIIDRVCQPFHIALKPEGTAS